MDPNLLEIVLLNDNAKMPEYAHPGEDAAFDVFSTEEFALFPSAKHTFNVGVASAFPNEFWLKFEPKSGHADRHRIIVLGGVIDSGYRDEWKIMLYNLGPKVWFVKKGMAIVQGVMHDKFPFNIVRRDVLPPSLRGKHGLGSGHQAATAPLA